MGVIGCRNRSLLVFGATAGLGLVGFFAATLTLELAFKAFGLGWTPPVCILPLGAKAPHNLMEPGLKMDLLHFVALLAAGSISSILVAWKTFRLMRRHFQE